MKKNERSKSSSQDQGQLPGAASCCHQQSRVFQGTNQIGRIQRNGANNYCQYIKGDEENKTGIYCRPERSRVWGPLQNLPDPIPYMIGAILINVFCPYIGAGGSVLTVAQPVVVVGENPDVASLTDP